MSIKHFWPAYSYILAGSVNITQLNLVAALFLCCGTKRFSVGLIRVTGRQGNYFIVSGVYQTIHED